MLEQAVAEVLQKTLGAYLKGVDAENLNLSVWSGDVRLRKVELRTEALGALPVRVLRGTVGEVRVEVPWRSLRSKPIVVHVERVLLLCAPKDGDEPWDAVAELERAREERRSRLAVLEEVEAKKGVFAQLGDRMGRSLIEGLLRRVVVRIADVHVRLECEAPPGALPRIAAVGATLRSLRLVADEEAAADEARAAPRRAQTEAIGPLFKLGACEGVSLYMCPAAASVVAEPAPGGKATVADPAAGEEEFDRRMLDRLLDAVPLAEAACVVLAPLDLLLRVRYDKAAPAAAALPGASPTAVSPEVEASLSAPRLIALSLSRTQYVAAIALAEKIARSERRHWLRACVRPNTTVAAAAREWWGYAVRAVCAELRARPGLRLSWPELAARRRRRVAYMAAYSASLSTRCPYIYIYK